jgi:hypothetical protein
LLHPQHLDENIEDNSDEEIKDKDNEEESTLDDHHEHNDQDRHLSNDEDIDSLELMFEIVDEWETFRSDAESDSHLLVMNPRRTITIYQTDTMSMSLACLGLIHHTRRSWMIYPTSWT